MDQPSGRSQTGKTICVWKAPKSSQNKDKVPGWQTNKKNKSLKNNAEKRWEVYG